MPMFSTRSFLCNLLFISVALAAPSGLNAWQSKNRVEKRSGVFNPSWSGAVIVQNHNSFNSIGYSIKVPSITGSSDSGLIIAAGIGGLACGNGVQAGIASIINSEGKATYNAFYDVDTEGSLQYFNMSVGAGDDLSVSISVNGSDQNTLVTTIRNTSNGQHASNKYSSLSSFCGESAEIIVDQMTANGTALPYADFDSVSFSDVKVNQGNISLQDFSPLVAEQNGENTATVTIGASTVSIASTT